MQILSPKNHISVNFENNIIFVNENKIVGGVIGGYTLAEYPTHEDAVKVFEELHEWYADHPETRVYVLPD
jgi:hypothetical protein